MRALLLFAAFALVAGCTTVKGSNSVSSTSFTQTMADAVSDECGADRTWIKVDADGTVRFEPPMDANYEVSACLVKGLKDSGATKFGFVGNEKYVPE